MALHVIVGAGPIGSATARILAVAGHQVRLVTRKGSPAASAAVDSALEQVAGDATDPAVMTRLAGGAAAIYNCANPPYHRWPTDFPPIQAGILAAAEATGAVYVSMSNLYAYGAVDHPMRPTDPLAATTRKGRVRAGMWEEALAAHAAGRVRVTELRASDYFGPEVLVSQLGERVVPAVLAGKAPGIVGRADMPHSFSYAPDVARTLATLGTDERALGRAWHAPSNPPLTQRAAVTALAAAAGVPDPGVRALPNTLVALAGLFSPPIREVREMLYQFDRPFEIDATETTAVFGISPTPLAEALAATVAWWRARIAQVGTNGRP